MFPEWHPVRIGKSSSLHLREAPVENYEESKGSKCCLCRNGIRIEVERKELHLLKCNHWAHFGCVLARNPRTKDYLFVSCRECYTRIEQTDRRIVIQSQ